MKGTPKGTPKVTFVKSWQYIILVPVLGGGYSSIGPFPTHEQAKKWIEDRSVGDTSILPCLPPESLPKNNLQ